MIDFSSLDQSLVSTILAWILTAIILSSGARLLIGVKARLTSWGLFLIVSGGVLFGRLPEAYGLTDVLEWQPLVRSVTYSIVILLNIFDWLKFFKLKRDSEKEYSTNE